MTPKSVKKKLKQPSFAAGVNRDEVRQGAEELGVDFDEHVANGDRGAWRSAPTSWASARAKTPPPDGAPPARRGPRLGPCCDA